ncbi:2-oxo-hepta-3-ene-1,7-dioic acid hydratase [Candidatus Rhodobacter oscarellae]|uniref:2-oxo-hepta-3-ene-1,7-dioic acid hydratase n=1 Tax=Candidatus Rhodobacter oscarellae TaxID=1675527 RepID=A0A0J9E619_9RHOB|nr:hypothetical protein [Candidatus Rhodobacter lobularis]KMW58200.1 2-oxo-hepta-3-ene-1,7-dioic acid hydratase [Candidatus Rhodobacter lobularis]
MTDHATDLLEAYDSGGQLPPFAQAYGVDLAQANTIVAQISARRQARGERIVGRKIGFTNRSIWELYNVDAPMWAPMYDTTVAALPADGVVTLPKLAEPRIEPEIAFCFSASPAPGMTVAEIAGCVEWIAHGFEIVTSPFPNWTFSLPDCTAAQSLHGCFWYGPPRSMPADPGTLERFSMTLHGPRGTLHGHATDVLDGPLHAVRFLMGELANQPGATPIAPGEIVTTGTLTDAGPVAPGETWQTELAGIDLPGATIHVAQ